MTIVSFFKQRQAILFNAMTEALPESLVVFGTGARGRLCKVRLERLGVRVPAFADNAPDRQGTLIDGIPVVAPAAIPETAPGVPVIVCSFALSEIQEQLFALGGMAVYTDQLFVLSDPQLLQANMDKVRAVHALLSDEESREQYKTALAVRFLGYPVLRASAYPLYSHPAARAAAGDVIVDGGAAVGDSMPQFLSDSGGDCSLHLFEPAPAMYARLCEELRRGAVQNAAPVNCALWSASRELRFHQDSAYSHANHLDEGGETVVRAVSLDDYAEDKGLRRIDLIKLDIEGAELEALAGARKTILRDRPKLQICLYHKDNDLWDIPLFIKNLVPEYKMYLAHHRHDVLDTVLYCAA